jgi:hypothetical protein
MAPDAADKRDAYRLADRGAGSVSRDHLPGAPVVTEGGSHDHFVRARTDVSDFGIPGKLHARLLARFEQVPLGLDLRQVGGVR